jgi:malonyl-CoA O-methyltransferase
MPEQPLFLPVDEAYDRWAGFYDAYDNPVVFAAEQVVQSLARGAAGKDVVELGCGTGRNLASFHAHGARRLTGVDLSPAMLQRARQRDPAWTLLQHDMMHPLPLADGSADLVLFSLTLEHVRELGPPFGEARRLLRPAGAIIVVEIHPFMSLGGAAAHFVDGDVTIEMPTFPHQFAAYLDAFAATGLRVTACREWRPRDLGEAMPAKALKRGPDFPLLVEFALEACG